MDGSVTLLASPYGDSAADLQLDFSAVPRPALVTRLLALHLRSDNGTGPAEDEIWEWSLTRRTRGLLDVAAATFGSAAELTLRCSAPDCGELIELEVDLERFREVGEPEAVSCTPAPEVDVQLRLPRGSDQRRWLAGGEVAPERLASDLVVAVDGERQAASWTIPEPWLGLLGEALAEQDPLTALELEASCPECGSPVRVELDLDALLIDRLAARQTALVDELYELALAFHWSEAEILSVPASRRRTYLSRLREEVSP